jgi:hypothetical protein
MALIVTRRWVSISLMTTTHIDALLSGFMQSASAVRTVVRQVRTGLLGAVAVMWLAGCSEYQPPTVSNPGPGAEAERAGASLSEAARSPVATKDVDARLRPVAAAVAMSGTPQVGRVVSGTYRWMADWPETDSVHLWEAASGPTRIRVVGRTREMMPSAGLRGVRIRYCVKPVTGQGDMRLAGYKTCSAWTTVGDARSLDAAG